MTAETFRASLSEKTPGADLPDVLQSLWWDYNDDWDRAHSIAQEIPSLLGSAIHAYLHRKEGVIWNADYWYRRAGRIRPDISLDDERERLLAECLATIET